MRLVVNNSIILTLAFFAGIAGPVKGQDVNNQNETKKSVKVVLEQTDTAQANAVKAAMQAEKQRLKTIKLGGGMTWVGDSMEVSENLRNTPKLGVYLENLDFEEAYQRHYPYNYGVLVTGVVKGGGADQAGIMEGDIIMTFDTTRVQYENHMVRLIHSKHVGDTLPITIFRDEKQIAVNVTLTGSQTAGGELTGGFTFSSGNRKVSVGYGAGGWTPMWLQQDLTDINGVLTKVGFNDIGKGGLLLQGGGGHGNVGNGWFIGGQGWGYSIDRKIGVSVYDTQVTRHMEFKMGMGGFTLDKRFALSRKVIPSLGIMVGGGSYGLKVQQTAGDYNWDSLGTGLASSSNNSIDLSRDFMVVQPRIDLLFRVLPWMSIKVQAGYVYGYSWHKGWKSNIGNDAYTINNAPDTPLEGPTASVGLWFGF